MGDLIFTVNEHIGDVSVSPDNVPLSLLSEFAKDVEQFIKGSARNPNAGELTVSIVPGSLGLKPCLPLTDLDFSRDVALLEKEDTLDLLDPKRRHIIEKWQARARKCPGRVYFIRDKSADTVVRITKDTRYRSTAAAAWVDVERFLIGEVEDMGGSSRPNVHVRVDGKMVTIGATVEALRVIEKNLVYKQSILHVKAQENIENGSLRNVTLVSAEPFAPAIDEEHYERAKQRARSAWEGVEDAAAWVRDLRGN